MFKKSSFSGPNDDNCVEVDLEWRKSSRSDAAVSCVEVANVVLSDDSPVTTLAGGVAVRHSKDPSGPMLVFTEDEWRAFIAGVKLGEFDLQ